MLDISGFSHVAIRVTDLARARRFYVDVLGLPVVLDLEDLVLVKIGGAGLLGIRGNAPETEPSDRFDPFRVGLDHVSFGVDSFERLDEIQRDLDAAGIPNDGVHDESLLSARGLVFYDPDGIALELYALES